MAYFINFSDSAPLPREVERRIIVDAKDKDELTQKLSKLFGEDVRVLFIDCLDMNGRDYDTEISYSFYTLDANVFWAEII
ncbi:hypothetical protein [Vibrio crassostreae]|uniref:hypothetical protein n=1 Tax=Vibrio crassostreae TaxID=246167 RepID=UPI001B31173A|nr:hypothetical protein [Vibrio crassostreae]